MTGLYLYIQWMYNHPYAAATWTLSDWKGFLDGLAALGFDLVQIWPMIDTMPVPPTRSDLRHLAKLRRVIRYAHSRHRFTVVIGAGANTAAGPRARSYPFSRRPYFEAEELVDPADRGAVSELMERRRRLLEPLAEADGFWVLDCDPGGFPGATSEQFLFLLSEHRRLLDSLRPGIELVYWMWAGWRETSFEESWQNAPQDAWREVIAALVRRAPEPWRVNACWPGHFLTLAEQGQLHRALYFPYNALEYEPSFPLTNWQPGPQDPLPAALRRIPAQDHPLGVMANAQSHCLQLPHIYLFSHLAQGRPLSSLDLPGFASRLLPAAAEPLSRGWCALAAAEPQPMEQARAELARLSPRSLRPGELGGLLFASPRRLIRDLILQLDTMASLARIRLLHSQDADPRPALRRFYTAASRWQQRHGFADWARGPFISTLHSTLEPLIPGISSLPFDPRHGYSLRLLQAVKNAAGA